jgi:hypothetical protein
MKLEDTASRSPAECRAAGTHSRHHVRGPRSLWSGSAVTSAPRASLRRTAEGNVRVVDAHGCRPAGVDAALGPVTDTDGKVVRAS